jgi:hypothetical protein
MENQEDLQEFETQIKILIDEIDKRFADKKEELLKDETKNKLDVIDTLIKHNNVMKSVYSAKYPDMAIELKYMFYMASIPLYECREYVIKGEKVQF